MPIILIINKRCCTWNKNIVQASGGHFCCVFFVRLCILRLMRPHAMLTVTVSVPRFYEDFAACATRAFIHPPPPLFVLVFTVSTIVSRMIFPTSALSIVDPSIPLHPNAECNVLSYRGRWEDAVRLLEKCKVPPPPAFFRFVRNAAVCFFPHHMRSEHRSKSEQHTSVDPGSTFV